MHDSTKTMPIVLDENPMVALDGKGHPLRIASVPAEKRERHVIAVIKEAITTNDPSDLRRIPNLLGIPREQLPYWLRKAAVGQEAWGLAEQAFGPPRLIFDGAEMSFGSTTKQGRFLCLSSPLCGSKTLLPVVNIAGETQGIGVMELTFSMAGEAWVASGGRLHRKTIKAQEKITLTRNDNIFRAGTISIQFTPARSAEQKATKAAVAYTIRVAGQ